MKRLLLLLLLGISACGPSAPPPPPPELVVAADPKPQPPATNEVKPATIAAAKAEPTASEPARIEISAPTARALGMKLPPLLESRARGPKVRDSGLERGEWLGANPAPTVVPIPLPQRKPVFPSPPGEVAPLQITDAALPGWRGLKFPDAPGVKSPPRPEPTAADVPRLGFAQPDRIPADDPTSEISTARIVNTLIVAPAITAPFIRLLLPDPFEFAGQLRLPAAPEFATTPVVVPPARP